MPSIFMLVFAVCSFFIRVIPSATTSTPLPTRDGDEEVMNTVLAVAATKPAQQDTSTAKKMLFIAIFSLGPSWQANKPAHEQAYFNEHSANLKKLRAEKKILVGARYSDKGLIIIAAANEQEARAMVEHDPMVANKVFNLELHQFTPFYKGCIDPQ
ncbi:YciI family protein [candidate division KSB1 bacterium]|nr:YciI family protein [candidate division KSB1 bacterium]